jgi:glutamine amidotransferase
MQDMKTSYDAAIIDYGMSNLFSVKNACEFAGLTAVITNTKEVIQSARLMILPGVGAFGDAMKNLSSLGLADLLKVEVGKGKILFGICLGMQLLMNESREFGRHAGLGIIDGDVIGLDRTDGEGIAVKVPEVGWNRIYGPADSKRDTGLWSGTFLEGVKDGEYMYFVHSYFVRPVSDDLILARASYGRQEFCSALSYKNVFACQFHPEKSGRMGILIYQNLAKMLKSGSN